MWALSSDGEPGLLAPSEIDRAGGNHSCAKQRPEPTWQRERAANNLDLYQVNCTFYDALGRRDNEYLIARAIQFFAPGIPQVYYVGLLAGTNDMELLARTRVGRDINRHYYTPAEIAKLSTKARCAETAGTHPIAQHPPGFRGHAHVELQLGPNTRDHVEKRRRTGQSSPVDLSEPQSFGHLFHIWLPNRAQNIGAWDSRNESTASEAIR